MKRAIILLAMLAAAGLAGAQMFAQLFGGAAVTPIPAVAWYKLDGNALDSSGNGYNGTATGAISTNGYYGGAYYFASTASHVTSSAASGFNTQSGTICFWAKMALPNTGFNYLFDTGGGSARRFLFFQAATVTQLHSDSTLRGNFYFKPTAEVWVHVAIVWGINVIYVNGSELYNCSDGGLGAGASTLCIGDKYSGTGEAADSAIDDFRVYNVPLSAANIQRIMTGQDVAPIEELQ